MPEEPLVYKVTFDTSEIPAKLQEIKSQLDQAMGAAAFSNTGADPYPFSQLFESGQAVTNFTNMAQQSFSTANNDMRQIFGRAAETARVGFNKFGEDFEIQGLISGAIDTMAKTGHQSLSSVAEQIQTRGWMSGLWGQMTNFGFGFLSSVSFVLIIFLPSAFAIYSALSLV